ncbi:MAG: choice-of-anchor D domain-containing protein, partial [Flavobacteriaceae bacterium]
MKTFTTQGGEIDHKKFLLLAFLTILSPLGFSQTSTVDVSINWPNWSSENRVEIYNPGGTLITTIDNGYTGCCNDSYSTTLSLGCLPDANNYYITMYDTYGDGWNGAASNITITSGGTTVLTNSGASASPGGTNLNFNVSGGCTTSCSSTVSAFPYTEGFETGIGQWAQSTSDNFDWSRRSGGTPSNNTGPNGANGGNWYMYTEASSNFNNTANLESPCFDLTSATSAQFSFYYHMFGANMGTLNVDLSTNGTTFPINLWSQSGQVQTSNGATWNQVLLDLTPYIGQTIKLRFSGTTGPGYRSDMAIDDISLTASTTPQPEIDIQGNAVSIVNGDSTPSTTDDTDFGTVNVPVGSATHTFVIQNLGTLPLNLTGLPLIAISGANAADFTVSANPTTPINSGNSTSFDITFDPSAGGTRTALVTIANNDSNENPYTFNILGYGNAPLTEGPGGVTTNLELWLKANDGAGLTDGTALSTWYDQAKTNNATVNTPGQEPTFRDHPDYNVNFNPVVDFANDYNTAAVDYTYADTTRDEMQGASGYFSDDIYVVVIPDINTTSSTPSLDIFCADSDTSTQATDGTGIGLGRYSVRFSNEVLSYAHGTTPNGSTPVNSRGYGVAQVNTSINYDNVGIINGRHNTNAPVDGYELLYNNVDVVNTEVGVPQFGTVNNANYWLGRSEGYRGSLDGRIVEVITYSTRNADNPNRNRIDSYLAIKYGITLGINGTSQDYVASDGNVIWDVSANTGYNYDIAGIGRDDDSDLEQKQSKSVNNGAIVAMSLDNTELTNNLNPNSFNTINEFLVWGNNGQNTNSSATSITVSLGPATITTVTDVMNREWKIVETAGDDVEKVEVSVFESDFAGLPPLTGNDAYVMLVADDPNFTSNLRTVFMDPSTFNGQATREGSFDFDGTKYFTFGVAHESVQDRHLDFDGIDNFTQVGDKVDLGGSFTASSWIKTDGANALGSDKTIVAKNNGTVGYKFFVTNSNIVSFSVGTTAADRIDSNTAIPDNVWHHVSVSYDGSIARLYIDGVLDNSKTLTSPTPNGSEFAIGAVFVDKADVRDYFKGSIDEIRVWDTALTPDQLRYVMNQELERSGAVVNGQIVPNTISKNEIATVNWANLLAYYSMNSYIGTHLNDVSGNGNRGSLTEPNQFDLEYQSSPLPYRSTTNGNWDNNSTWLNGSEQYIPGSPSIVDPNITVDWNIVETSHDITMNNAALPAINNDNRSVLALEVTSNELTVDTDNALTVTHYLKVDGLMDLVGESQLIQTQGSDLDVT